ncbi:N-methylglutamate dehydrogenase subunit D [Actinomycetospora succinea]|uniref:N-methylglutamate dehydrogenase subunit D n=1 Tax=Actinomycetospora succinea TaxID=663603 RepID=A0A4R6VS39_9PSEU|nr:sarcosine oxidase subunit gamma family protein [Actinomycetospora succinea]TDQ65437.1 N-methylglutamate dehydrogenase subunit D [Actinomycetospora succinea]
MSDTTPLARGPVAVATPVVRDGWELDARVATGPLTLSDESPLAKVHVRAPFDGASRAALGVGLGRTARGDLGTGDVLVVGSGPGEWLVLGAPGTASALRASIEQRLARTGEFTTVLDLTHGRALLRLTGPTAARVLAGVCAIDFSDAVTPDGAALRTSLAAVVTDVVRDDRSGVPSYLLHVERSSGQYLADALLDAGRGSGLEMTGFRGLG